MTKIEQGQTLKKAIHGAQVKNSSKLEKHGALASVSKHGALVKMAETGKNAPHL